MKLCVVEGCFREVLAKGLCNAHYQRLRLTGDLKPEIPARTLAPKGAGVAFIESVVNSPRTDECILWPYGSRDGVYGGVVILGEKRFAHREVLIRVSGVDNKDMEAAHGPCHTPLCVNPAHLSWKTRKENNADRLRDGTSVVGEGNPAAKLTALHAETIRVLREERGISYRVLSRAYGVSKGHISNICAKRVWG